MWNVCFNFKTSVTGVTKLDPCRVQNLSWVFEARLYKCMYSFDPPDPKPHFISSYNHTYFPVGLVRCTSRTLNGL